MEQNQSNKILIWGLITAVVVASVWAKINFSKSSKSQNETNFSYEMPRPNELVSDFDLSGREIDREILKNVEKEKAKKDAIKKEDKKKQADAKKKQQKNSSKSVGKKKGSLRVDIVDAVEGRHFTDEGGSNSNSPVPTYTVLNDKKKGKENSDKDQDDDDSELKLTKQQWRNLLQSQDGQASVSNFLMAHSKGYISDEDFYEISFELVQDQNEERKKIGLSILTQDQSSKAFGYLAKYYSKLSETVRSQIWKIMLTYAQPQKFSRLQVALTSKDKATTTLALQVLEYAIKEMKTVVALQQGTISQGRGLAGQANPQTLTVFINTLKWISSSSTDLTTQAQSLLTEIQTLNKA